MFWGLCLEPESMYTEEVSQPYHISQASLDVYDEEIAKIWLQKGGQKYLLACISETTPNCRLDVVFDAGEKITLFTSGTTQNVYLSGFTVPGDVLDLINNSQKDTKDTKDTKETKQTIYATRLSTKRESTSTETNSKVKKPKIIRKSQAANEENAMNNAPANEKLTSQSSVKILSKQKSATSTKKVETHSSSYNKGHTADEESIEEKEKEKVEKHNFSSDRGYKAVQEAIDPIEQSVEHISTVNNVNLLDFIRPAKTTSQCHNQISNATNDTFLGKTNPFGFTHVLTSPVNEIYRAYNSRSSFTNSVPTYTPYKENDPHSLRAPNSSYPSSLPPFGMYTENNSHQISTNKNAIEDDFGMLGPVCVSYYPELYIKVKELFCGVKVQDLRIGNGAKAVSGCTMNISYSIFIPPSNEKVYSDQVKIKLGAGANIFAWNLGLDGMQTGGVRVIFSPPLNEENSFNFPKNVPLVFEIKFDGFD